MWIFKLIKILQKRNSEEIFHEVDSMMRSSIVIYEIEEWSVYCFSS